MTEKQMERAVLEMVEGLINLATDLQKLTQREAEQAEKDRDRAYYEGKCEAYSLMEIKIDEAMDRFEKMVEDVMNEDLLSHTLRMVYQVPTAEGFWSDERVFETKHGGDWARAVNSAHNNGYKIVSVETI